jgi:hypothetical protein
LLLASPIVQAGLDPVSQGRAAEEVEEKERPLEAADLVQGPGEAALPRACRQLAHQVRRQGDPGTDRGDQALEVRPVVGEELLAQPAADHGRERRPACGIAEDVKTGFGQIADPGDEPEAQQAAEAEDDLGEAAGVGGMLLDCQAGLVKQETVQDVRRLMRRGGDHLGVEGTELVREMAVEADAGLVAVAGVELGAGRTMAAGLEELAVGRRHSASTPR